MGRIFLKEERALYNGNTDTNVNERFGAEAGSAPARPRRREGGTAVRPSAQEAERPARPQGFLQHLVSLKPHFSRHEGLPLILNTT